MAEPASLGWFSAAGRLMVLPTDGQTLEIMGRYPWLRPATPLELVNYRICKGECLPFIQQLMNRLLKEACDAG